MNAQEINEIVKKQRRFFNTGATLELSRRIEALVKLKNCIQKYSSEIHQALRKDLG